MIKIENVNKYFNKGKKNQIHVIDNTSLELDKTGLVALLGPSGSGKTTLLNVIGGLDKVNKGKIYINGKKITKKSSHRIDKIRNLNIGYIFQNYELLNNLTVYDNIAIALKMIGIKDKAEIKKRVDYVLEKVNMYRYRNRLASMLSGGERQRIGIARAIVKNPNIIIADEPTGNLDSKNSIEIMNIIKAISKEKLVILVTHEVDLAKFYASRIIELKDGKIEADYENVVDGGLDYRIDNKFYLKDFNNHKNLQNDNINFDIYSEEEKPINLKIVAKNGNIYIQSENREKLEIIDVNSNIELIDEHYKKIDKKVYQEYEFNFEKIINKKIKEKYSSIFNPITLLINGYKKIINYSNIKKILLIGFFLSAMFIVYAFSNIAGILQVKDENFVSKNKNYLFAQIPVLNVDKFKEYESANNVEYVLPGESQVEFNMELEDYYQSYRMVQAVSGSLSSLNMITSNDIVLGEMPKEENEVVLDKLVLDSIIKDNTSYALHIGINTPEQVIGRNLKVNNIDTKFKIVGIVDLSSPSIYTDESAFINILSNKEESTYIGYDVEYAKLNSTAKVLDYELKQDKIELTKGTMPKNDYEVIVSESHKYEMPLNKTIDIKVNDTKLKVVGYYTSKDNLDLYLVNNNTVKYDLIVNSRNIVVYSNDKESTIQDFRENSEVNLQDSYLVDKENYISARQDAVISNLIVSGIILAISLIEIFLMMRSSFLSRIKEVGIYRAIGAKKSDIYKMFLGEIIAISTTASLLGIAFMSYILKSLLSVEYFKNMFVLNAGIVILSIIVVFAFNIIVGLLPVANVIRKRPAQILSRTDI